MLYPKHLVAGLCSVAGSCSELRVCPGQSPYCAPGRDRTCDQVLRRHLLYPLSYGRSGSDHRTPGVPAGPRAVVYVACDPASLARDVAAFAGAGYRLTGLRGFDAFPMTAHVECVALLERA